MDEEITERRNRLPFNERGYELQRPVLRLERSNQAFDAAYRRHYKDLVEGPIGQAHAKTIEKVDELIAELGKLTQKRSQA